MEETTNNQTTQGGAPEANLSGAKILVVEDDKFLRELLVRKLEGEGLNITTAVDGSEAIIKAKEVKPVLILLDLILPSMDGFDVLKELKASPETQNIPVIILSNLGQKEEVEKGLTLGAEDYLIKAHFTPDEIVGKIDKVLKEAR